LSLLGLLGVVATQLLVLRQLSRLDPDSPAEQAVSKDLLAIISTRFKLQGATTRDFWVHVARLGGFIGRKSDGDPGWRTIWAGWNRLIDMAYGYMMARTYG